MVKMIKNPHTSTNFITRRCSCLCPYCKIYDNECKDKEPEYWAELLQEIYDKWDIHTDLYGGEPLEYMNDFNKLVKLVNIVSDIGISYSVNSSSNFLNKKRAKILSDNGLMNWTASVDSLHDSRSRKGMKALEWFDEFGVSDLMTETVIFPGRVRNVSGVLDWFVSKNFWISFSFLSYGKTPNYDSFPSSKELKMKTTWDKTDVKQIRQLREKVIVAQDNGFERVHGGFEQFLDMWDKEEMLYQKYDCRGELVSFHVNNNGKMRLCRDIGGKRVKKWNAFDAIDNYDMFYEDWLKDYKEFCRKCNWTCVIGAKIGKEHIKHVK